MARRVVAVFGASGFIGRHLVKRLAAQGWIVRAAQRDAIAAEFLRPMGDVGQVITVSADVTDPRAVATVVAGADAVINLVGVLYERRGASFDTIHVKAATAIAEAAKAAGVRTLLHMSALGADKGSTAAYARSKAQAEEAVKAAFPGVTIFRPSVVFGADDDFFNRFAALARLSPVLPVFTKDGLAVKRGENGFELDLFGSGGPVFQPVFVGDVADAMVKVLDTPALVGKTYELGGPRRYSLKEIYELVLRSTGRCALLVPVPFAIAAIQAKLLGLLPKPPLTSDQLKLMQTDNVVRGRNPGLAELGITPATAETVVPTYLHRHLPTEQQPLARAGH